MGLYERFKEANIMALLGCGFDPDKPKSTQHMQPNIILTRFTF